MQDFKAKLVDVKMQDGSSAGVLVFDMMQVLMNMLEDGHLVNKDTIAVGYDIWTGKAEPSNQYSEIHTGDLWEPARARFIGDDTEKFPMPLTVFYDKTQTCSKGTLSVAPFMVTFTFLNRTTRRKTYATFPIGLVPNLKLGKSSDNKELSTQDTLSQESVLDEHNCLYAILEGMIENAKNEGEYRMVFGKKKKCVVWIHFIIGDIEGNNRLAGAYACNTSAVQKPYRCCKCRDLDNTDIQCEWVTTEEVSMYKAGVKEFTSKSKRIQHMQVISRHPVRLVFERGVPISDMVHGINFICPPKLLHTIGVGVCPYVINHVHTKMKTVKEDKTI